MVNGPTPWIVRTSKRSHPISASGPRKRPPSTEDVEDEWPSVPRKPRQQTLTQIDFVPYLLHDHNKDDLKPIVNVPRRAPTKHSAGSLQKQNSTLTQMDLLTASALRNDQENELTPLGGDDNVDIGEGRLVQLDGSRDVPDTKPENGTSLMTNSTSKRKATPAVSQEPQERKSTKRKRPTEDERMVTPLRHGRRASSRVASLNATKSIRLLSARYGRDHDDSLESVESPSVRNPAAAPRAQSISALLQEPSTPASDRQNEPRSQHSVLASYLPRTPSKWKKVVPSSQSPESLPPSTRRTARPGAFGRTRSYERSPLKERSVNLQLSQRKKGLKGSSSNHVQMPSSPKKKICVLKLPIQRLHRERAPVETAMALSENSIWSPPSSSPRIEESEKPSVVPFLEVKDSTECSDLMADFEEHQQLPTLEIKDSVEEEVLEISATSQLSCQDGLEFSPGAVETQEMFPTLRGLLRLRDAPEEAIDLPQPSHRNQIGTSEFVVKDFAFAESHGRAGPLHEASSEDVPPTFVQKRASSVADSVQEEGSVLALSPGSSIANDTQFNAELAERIWLAGTSPPPSPIASRHGSHSPSSQLGREIEFSLPRPNLVSQPSTYSTVKTVPLNDTSSSPSLPSRSTQRTVYPASLPRPSQVSTQDPTQSYLPMSSIPLAPFSSPTRCGPTTITIKDSSSVPRPLHDIPLQRHSQSPSSSPSQLNVNLGLDDCLDPEDDDGGLDEELVAMSDKIEGAIEDQEESQVVPLPVPLLRSTTRDKDEVRSNTATEKGSSVPRRRRPRKPVIPPEVRALLGESFLESVPGPPGWSQRSWDDEPL